MVRSQARYMANSDRRTSAEDANAVSSEENPNARLLGLEDDQIVKAETGTAPEGIWSRETGSAVPSRASLLIFILRLNLVLTYGFLPISAAASIYLFKPPYAIGSLPLEMEKEPPTPPPESATTKALLLVFATTGLLVSYITWGYVQETVKVKRYGQTDDFAGEPFPSDVFLVFGNRLLAVIVAAAMVMLPIRREPAGGWAPQAPWASFAPCSLSNVMSSFAQYHCLDYISFPLQVVSKSCKVVPVMLVGKFVHGKSYPWVEYIEAVAIGVGVSLFSLSQKGAPDDDNKTQALGLFFVAMYLVCDSFTSQWQDRIFKKHKIDQFQMMFGVNCFSIIFTVATLLWNGGFVASLRFLSIYPEAVWHVLTLSITSATGQLFIFFTIKKFGPIIFTIIMTTRQMVSLVVSAIVYQHLLGLGCWLGAMVVFGTIGYRIRRRMLSRG